MFLGLQQYHSNFSLYCHKVSFLGLSNLDIFAKGPDPGSQKRKKTSSEEGLGREGCASQRGRTLLAWIPVLAHHLQALQTWDMLPCLQRGLSTLPDWKGEGSKPAAGELSCSCHSLCHCLSAP